MTPLMACARISADRHFLPGPSRPPFPGTCFVLCPSPCIFMSGIPGALSPPPFLSTRPGGSLSSGHLGLPTTQQACPLAQALEAASFQRRSPPGQRQRAPWAGDTLEEGPQEDRGLLELNPAPGTEPPAARPPVPTRWRCCSALQGGTRLPAPRKWGQSLLQPTSPTHERRPRTCQTSWRPTEDRGHTQPHSDPRRAPSHSQPRSLGGTCALAWVPVPTQLQVPVASHPHSLVCPALCPSAAGPPAHRDT